MGFLRSEKYARPGNSGRAVMLSLICLLIVGGWLLASPSVAKGRSAPVLAPHTLDPEVLLIDIYKDLAIDHLRTAQAKADVLVQMYPNFRLGQLLRGDLLLMHTQAVRTFGAAKGPKDKLEDLREEARVRLRALRERPDPKLVPRSVLQLRDDQKHVLVVDASRARLYVYENQHGQLKLVTDYYISHGRLGVNKSKAGDQKTPLGVYYITSRVPGPKLPQFYGTGALPINYPNEWDKRNGRSGSGIWLHGSPIDVYSRPPLSSDGCVVLTNPDINKLYGEVEVNNTPVIISDKVEFISRSRLASERNTVDQLIDAWRQDVQSLDTQRVAENYSHNFRSERGDSAATWIDREHRILQGARNLSVHVGDISVFFYPGREDMIVATFTRKAVAGRFSNTARKRQYWIREKAGWKILSEGDL